VAFEINLREAVFSLSDALDLVGIDDVYHGKRVAMMAAECARALGWPQSRIDDLIAASMLHDLGVSSTCTHRHLIEELDWQGSEQHCRIGHALLRDCPPLSALADVVLHHHAHWDELSGLGLPSQVAEDANLIFLADRVDALVAQRAARSPLIAREAVCAVIGEHRGGMFAPALVDIFMDVCRVDAFWLEMEPRFVARYLQDWVQQGVVETIAFQDLQSIARMFSNCVDAKSAYTAAHSRGVARLARALGGWAGLSTDDCDKLELAGLFHDLGKLRVPDEILDKPGPLDQEEFMVMERHSFDSRMILEGVHGLEDVALWASEHHEGLDGRGYPYRHAGDQIAIHPRILAVADVYQALAQDRPYRGCMPAERILAVLDEMVAAGKLDGDLVGLVHAHEQTCWDLARAADSGQDGADVIP